MKRERGRRGEGRGRGKHEHTTNRMPLDLLRELLQHIDLALSCIPLLEPLHHIHDPVTPLTTRRTLPAALMLIEGAQSAYHRDHVRALVHHDDGRGAKARLRVLQRVEVHELVVADVLGKDGRGAAARDDGL